MELKNAILCIDCEWVYAQRTTCPRCGSHVAFPISRALAPSEVGPREAVRPLFLVPNPMDNVAEFYRPVSAPVAAYAPAALAATA